MIGHPKSDVMGHKRTFAPQKVMSALPPKADMCRAASDVRFGPKADIETSCRRCLRVLDFNPVLSISLPELSAYVSDALLGIYFGHGRWLRWQLKHRCLLTFT
jgi:hypothetical protein